MGVERSVGLEDAEFVARLEGFTGSLSELAHALRTRALLPESVDVFKLVRDYLVTYRQLAERDLELATETLPQVARVIELKTRLLLPRPPKEAAEDVELELALEAVDLLAGLEDAILFLKRRREARRVVLQAHAPRPGYPRPERALRVSPARLGELASRHYAGGYFELALERLSVGAAIEHVTNALKRLRRGFLADLAPTADWPTLAVSFAGVLELVREGRVRATQERPFEPIALELLEEP